jgi:hypothetical protein
MSSAGNVYVEVVLNVNIQFEPPSNQPLLTPVVSISCRGRWRNCFTKPERLEEIFNNGGEGFSVAQNDECEAAIKNTLKSSPSLLNERGESK